MLIQVVLDAADNGGRERTQKIIDEDADGVCAVCAQTASCDVRLIAQLFGHTQDLLPDGF
jgi:hypothetical protein